MVCWLLFCMDRQTDGRQTVADTNKGVVEVQAIRLRTNISIYTYIMYMYV